MSNYAILHKIQPSVTVWEEAVWGRVQRNVLTSDRAKEMMIHLLMSRNMASHEVLANALSFWSLPNPKGKILKSNREMYLGNCLILTNIFNRARVKIRFTFRDSGKCEYV